MPELREVFEMTTKQMDPDVESWRDQERRQRKRARNRKVGGIAVAAAIAIVAVVAIAQNLGADRSRVPLTEPSPATLPTAAFPYTVDLGSGATAPLPDGLAAAYSYPVSPDGTRFAFAPPCCGPGDRITIANVDGSDPRKVTPRGLDVVGPAWSPDGSRLVYQGRDATGQLLGDLFVLDIASGEQTMITDLPRQEHDWWFMSPTFAPDGETVVFHRPRGESPDVWDLWSVPATGGEPTVVRRDAGFARFSPDGGTMAFLSPISDSNFAGDGLWMVDAAGGDAQLLVEGPGIWWPRWSPDGTQIAYGHAGKIVVVDVAIGSTREVARGAVAEWLDDATLIVTSG